MRWAFAPNGWTTPACGSIAPCYPGDEVVAQTGTAPIGGDRDGWRRAMFDVLTADPNVVGFLYFNTDKSSLGGNQWDWRIFDEVARTGAMGFVEGMQRPSTL